MHTNIPQLEYKGYKGLLRLNPKDNRFWGKICTPESPDIPMDSWGFAADTLSEAQSLFESQVNRIISNKLFSAKCHEWKSKTDHESIRCVFNILPDDFKSRLDCGSFDTSLLTKVLGGDYEVPLYYITKAWDVILKGSLIPYDYMIGPEEDEDCTQEDIQAFLVEEVATRTRCSACKDNDKMKSLWKEYFNIDIDGCVIDFTQYNKHLPPNVTDEEYEDYFNDVPYGVNEWILDRINSPELKSISHDYVSSLMEFTAQMLMIRNDEL